MKLFSKFQKIIKSQKGDASDLLKTKTDTLTKENTNKFKKIENPFFEGTLNNKTNMRSIIDNTLTHEDIFKYIIKQSEATLPEQSKKDENKITVFVPLDDFLIYSYIPDQNLGFYDKPKIKNFHFQVDLIDFKTVVYVYLRDHLLEFLDYLDIYFEPILYTTGEKLYVDKVIVNNE